MEHGAETKVLPQRPHSQIHVHPNDLPLARNDPARKDPRQEFRVFLDVGDKIK